MHDRNCCCNQFPCMYTQYGLLWAFGNAIANSIFHSIIGVWECCPPIWMWMEFEHQTFANSAKIHINITDHTKVTHSDRRKNPWQLVERLLYTVSGPTTTAKPHTFYFYYYCLWAGTKLPQEMEPLSSVCIELKHLSPVTVLLSPLISLQWGASHSYTYEYIYIYIHSYIHVCVCVCV